MVFCEEMIKRKECKLALMYLKEIASLLTDAKLDFIASSQHAELYNVMMEEQLENFEPMIDFAPLLEHILNWAYEKIVDTELSTLVVQVEKLSEKIKKNINVEHERQETSV